LNEEVVDRAGAYGGEKRPAVVTEDLHRPEPRHAARVEPPGVRLDRRDPVRVDAAQREDPVLDPDALPVEGERPAGGAQYPVELA
jgi:hypothetical protein